MQELTSPQSPTGPYTPAGGAHTMPPALQSGVQGAAQTAQSYGRGQDSVMVHMTPDEVNSLRGLAQHFGGDLSTNPHTGMPEAGFLSSLLPTLLGGLGMLIGIPPVWMGAAGVAGGTAATGDLGKGLLMGLGAFGGASAVGALGGGSALAHVGAGLPGGSAAIMNPVASAAGAGAPGAAVGGLGSTVVAEGGVPAFTNAAGGAATAVAEGGVPAFVNPGAELAKKGLFGQFGAAAKAGLPSSVAKYAAPAAALGLVNSVGEAMRPGAPKAPEADKPVSSDYKAAPRSVITPDAASPVMGGKFDPTNFDSSERKWFNPSRPAVLDGSGNTAIPGTNDGVQPAAPVAAAPTVNQPNSLAGLARAQMAKSDSPLYRALLQGGENPGFDNPIWDDPSRWAPGANLAAGGEVFHMEAGGHVMPAKTVAAFGNFSTDAGQQKLAQMGGVPIRGPGDGVSDSIPARIDGNQEARVANGEVYFPPKAVQKMGGNEKLYAMMKRAEQAANQTRNGEKVRGLGALTR